MLKTALIAASLLVAAAGGAAVAQDMRAQYPDSPYGYPHSQYGADSFSGVNRYCAPGEIPQPFPNGNGIRCELPGGGYRYY